MRSDPLMLAAKWMVNTAVLFVIVKTVKGLNVSGMGMSSFLTLAAAAMVIGLLNSFIRPLIILLTLPLNVLSFGLFTLAINASVFFMTGWLIKGFEVKSLWGAMIGSLIFSVVTMITGFFMRTAPQRERESIKAKYKVIE